MNVHVFHWKNKKTVKKKITDLFVKYLLMFPYERGRLDFVVVLSSWTSLVSYDQIYFRQSKQ